MMILFAAGLMTRTLGKLKAIDLGFDPGRVLMLRIDPGMSGDSPEQSDPFLTKFWQPSSATRDNRCRLSSCHPSRRQHDF